MKNKKAPRKRTKKIIEQRMNKSRSSNLQDIQKKTIRLRFWMAINRLTIQDFATLVGVTRDTVHNWMRGDKKPRISSIEKISEVTLKGITSAEQLLDES